MRRTWHWWRFDSEQTLHSATARTAGGGVGVTREPAEAPASNCPNPGSMADANPAKSDLLTRCQSVTPADPSQGTASTQPSHLNSSKSFPYMYRRNTTSTKATHIKRNSDFRCVPWAMDIQLYTLIKKAGNLWILLKTRCLTGWLTAAEIAPSIFTASVAPERLLTSSPESPLTAFSFSEIDNSIRVYPRCSCNAI